MTAQTYRSSAWLHWLAVSLGGATLLIVVWACLTAWGAVLHGHPAYAIALGLSAVGGILLAWTSLRQLRRQRSGHQRTVRRAGSLRLVGRIALAVLGVVWILILAWLRPFVAIEPAIAAMQSNATVTVSESATEVLLLPVGESDSTGVFFQPGARVDARAYAAVLRPIAESGHTVVIAKQPLGIGFLAVSAFDGARSSHPEVSEWVIGGHSLGGTVAAMEAVDSGAQVQSPVVGLLFYASYPANDIRSSLNVPVESISGSRDGLATPTKIKDSKALLPSDAGFTVVEGGSHAQFGDYGPQPGDNTPTISDDDARQQISEASAKFVDSVSD